MRVLRFGRGREVGPGTFWGLGFRVWGLGFKVWVLGFRVWGLGFRFQGLGFRGGIGKQKLACYSRIGV